MGAVDESDLLSRRLIWLVLFISLVCKLPLLAVVDLGRGDCCGVNMSLLTYGNLNLAVIVCCLFDSCCDFVLVHLFFVFGLRRSGRLGLVEETREAALLGFLCSTVSIGFAEPGMPLLFLLTLRGLMTLLPFGGPARPLITPGLSLFFDAAASLTAPDLLLVCMLSGRVVCELGSDVWLMVVEKFVLGGNGCGQRVV